MAIEFKDPIIITEDTKLFGYNNTDINDIPTETGNFNIGNIVLLTKLNLSSNLSVIKNTENNLQYDLNIDGKKVTSFEIPADRFIKSVTFDNNTKKLKFVFISSEGEIPVEVDISSLIDTYTAGDGLKLENNKFSLDLLQASGQNTTKAMSQKAVTDSLNELKSDLVAKSDVLSLKEIQASTDTTNKVASADSVKQLDNNKLNIFRIGTSNGFFATIGNIGDNAKDITIQLTDTEQTVFIFGSGSSISNYMTMLAGGNNLDYSFGKDNLVSKSKNDKTIIVTLQSWFRGCFFSYLPFKIIEN